MENHIEAYLDSEASESTHRDALNALHREFFPNLLGLLSHDIMKTALISEVEKTRYRAALLLADLVDMPVDTIQLSDHAVHLLIAFFSSRMSDYPSVVPSLKALKALSYQQLVVISKSDHNLILSSMFNELSVQSMAQSIRQRIFELLLQLFSNPAAVHASQDIGTEVVKGTLAAVSGEKDPRCLLLCFQVMDRLQQQYSIFIVESVHLDLFEAMVCYFPITFTPPPDDPYGITPEALTAALQSCMCCHRLLVSFIVPFLLDQLSSDSLAPARQQALECLVLIAQRHSLKELYFALPDLANDLYTLISESASAQSQSGLKAQWVVTELCRSATNELQERVVEGWTLFGGTLISKVAEVLSDGADGLQAVAAMKVAVAMTGSSYVVLSHVLEKLFPILSIQVDAIARHVRDSISNLVSGLPQDEAPFSPACLQHLSLLLGCVDPRIDLMNYENNAFALIAGAILQSISSIFKPTAPFISGKTKGLAMFPTKTLLLVASALQCSKELLLRAKVFSIPSVLIEAHLKMCADVAILGPRALVAWMGDSRGAADVLRSAARGVVVALSDNDELQDIVLINCIQRARQRIDILEAQENASSEDFMAAYALMSSICVKDGDVQAIYFNECIPILFHFAKDASESAKLSVIAISQIIGELSTSTADLTLLRLIYLRKDEGGGTGGYNGSYLHGLDTLACSGFAGENLVATTGLVLGSVFGLLPTSAQDNLAPLLLQTLSSGSQCALHLSISVFAALRCDSQMLLDEDLSILCDQLFDKIENDMGDVASSLLVETCSELLAVVVNKLPVTKMLHVCLARVVDLCTSRRTDSIVRACLLLRISRSMLMRSEVSMDGASLQAHLIATLSQGLEEDTEDAVACSLHWGLLLQDNTNTPLSGGHCYNASLIWRQRTWHRLLPTLLAMQQQAYTTSFPTALMCICIMTSNIAGSFPLTNVVELLSLTVKALSCAGASEVVPYVNLRHSALDAMQALTRVDSSAAAAHLSSLIPLLMQAACADRLPSRRTQSLEILMFLSTLPFPQVFPVKARVIKGLARAVDDPKRKVRQLAARVRNEWIGIRS